MKNRISALWTVLRGKPLIYRAHIGPVVVEPLLTIIETHIDSALGTSTSAGVTIRRAE